MKFRLTLAVRYTSRQILYILKRYIRKGIYTKKIHIIGRTAGFPLRMGLYPLNEDFFIGFDLVHYERNSLKIFVFDFAFIIKAVSLPILQELFHNICITIQQLTNEPNMSSYSIQGEMIICYL